jgi:hypothetical protein
MLPQTRVDGPAVAKLILWELHSGNLTGFCREILPRPEADSGPRLTQNDTGLQLNSYWLER